MRRENTYSLIESIRKTIHCDDYTVDDLADQLGISANLVYRMAIEGESGDGFLKHLQRLVQLIKCSRKDYIIQTICRLCGGYFSREPRTGQGKAEREIEIADFNLEYALLLKTFALLLKEPTRTLKAEFDQQLDGHIAHFMEMRRKAETDHKQTSLIDRLEEPQNA